MILFYIIVSSLTASGITPECETEWKYILSSPYNPDLPIRYSKMYFYSGFSINNLGNFESCKEIDGANFVVEVYSSSPSIVVTLCGPEACTESDYYESPLPSTPPPMAGTYSVVFPEEYQDKYYGTYSYGAICMIMFIGIVAALALQGAFIDYFLSSEKENSKIVKYLLCFSLITNGKNFLTSTARQRHGKRDPLELLSGLKFLSIGWVVLGHVLLYYFSIATTNNFDTQLDMLDKPVLVLGYGGFYAVDAFFWASGLLLGYLFTSEVNKNENFSTKELMLFYLHRYLRITPVYLFCTLFFWSLMPYIGSGPLWFNTKKIIGDCEENWYANLLYVSNFIFESDNACLPSGWYLAADMQLFIVSTIIVLVYTKLDRVKGWALIFILCCINAIVSGIIAEKYDLIPVIVAAKGNTYYHDYYYKRPYTRMAPYFLGTGCGFIVYTYRRFQDTNYVYDRFALYIAMMQDVWYIRTVFFGIGLGLINFIIFSQYSFYKDPGENYQFENWSDTEYYAFIAFERVIYGLGLSFLLLPVVLGHFQLVTDLLSFSAFNILSKLTFIVYLLNYIYLRVVYTSQTTEVELNQFNLVKDSTYLFLVCLIAAAPIALLIEIPAANLESLVFNRNSNQTQGRTKSSSGENKKNRNP